MNRQFTYKEKFHFGYFYPVIAFGVIAVLCSVNRWGIAFKNLSLLVYPNSVYVSAGIGFLFLLYALNKTKRAIVSRKNPFPITIEQDGFSFPKGSGKVFIAFADIEELYGMDSEDDGRSYEVRAAGKHYSFYEERFESVRLFNDFIGAIEENAGR